jgi:hypothetical protein
MVESALEKLRLERESRSRLRANPSPSQVAAANAPNRPGERGDRYSQAPPTSRKVLKRNLFDSQFR